MENLAIGTSVDVDEYEDALAKKLFTNAKIKVMPLKHD